MQRVCVCVGGVQMQRLFYGCSYMYHLSGNNRRDSGCGWQPRCSMQRLQPRGGTYYTWGPKVR